MHSGFKTEAGVQFYHRHNLKMKMKLYTYRGKKIRSCWWTSAEENGYKHHFVKESGDELRCSECYMTPDDCIPDEVIDINADWETLGQPCFLLRAYRKAYDVSAKKDVEISLGYFSGILQESADTVPNVDLDYSKEKAFKLHDEDVAIAMAGGIGALATSFDHDGDIYFRVVKFYIQDFDSSIKFKERKQ